MSDHMGEEQPPLRLARARVLCVDDDQRLLAVQQMRLRKLFDVHVATSAAAALGKIDRRDPFAVVISDLRMPQSDGLMLLSAFRRISPMTVRVLLSGFASFESVVACINDAGVFRVLFKPVDAEPFIKAIADAADHHRELLGERDIVRQTLDGAVALLGETLMVTNPVVAARAMRVRRLAGLIAERITPRDRWLVELAALASHIGYLGLPHEAQERMVTGGDAVAADGRTLERADQTTAALFQQVPRLEMVRDSIRMQRVRFDLAGGPNGVRRGIDLPVGARILHIVGDADALMASGKSPSDTLAVLDSRQGVYDPSIVKTLRDVLEAESSGLQSHVVPLAAVVLGMRILEDVYLPGGGLLMPRGYEVTPGVLARIEQLPPQLLETLVHIGPTGT